MTVLQETADVARPIDEVFAYVSDFTTTQEWDATAISARKLTPGKVAEGTEFEVVCALPVGSIDINYKIEALEHNKRVVLSGSSRFFDIRDTISFSPSQRGTKIEYRAEFFFKPMIGSIASISSSGLESMGREGERVSNEIKALCNKGDESGAREVAMDYVKLMTDNETIEEMKRCSELMRKAMPSMELPEMPSAETYAKEADNICDNID